ncbi:MAG: hypothetical protein D3910_22790, partial [Candidatus Electrothrix sp. ATG2]|nr:hypothetical protein [Candidatus Electrothrix sp. ATG2]
GGGTVYYAYAVSIYHFLFQNFRCYVQEGKIAGHSVEPCSSFREKIRESISLGHPYNRRFWLPLQ